MKKIITMIVLLFLFSCSQEPQNINIIEEEKVEETNPTNNTINQNDKIKGKLSWFSILSSYYHWLSVGDYKDAYNWKYEPKITFEQFKSLYLNENWEKYYITNFIENDLDIYSYDVWELIEPNPIFAKYKVKAEIIEWKIQILDTKKVITELIEEFNFDWWKLISQWDKWIKNLYIDTNKEKKLLLSKKLVFHNGRFDIPSYWSNFHSFSIKNKHIIKFIKPEWEMGEYYEYDIYTDILSKVSYDDFYEEN